MKAPIFEELKAKWAQLRRQTSGTRSVRRKASDRLREFLEQTIEAGTYISKGAERGALQALAREIADAIFQITSEYPTATIRAPLDVTTRPEPVSSAASQTSSAQQRFPSLTIIEEEGKFQIQKSADSPAIYLSMRILDLQSEHRELTPS